MERPKFPPFSEEEMQKQFSCSSVVAPLENDDDEWKVGEWTSSADTCNIAGGETRRGPKKGLQLPMLKEQSSFETLDLRAAEVLDKSMRALESSTSLTSWAMAMTMDYPHFREGGGGGCKIVKGKQKGERTYNLGPSEHLHSCQNRGGATRMWGCHGCDSDIARVLKEIIINNNNDYGVKLCNLAQTHKDTDDRMLVKDFNNVKTKENTFEEGCLDCRSGQVLPRPASQDPRSMRQADAGASAENMRNATRATAPTLDELIQTKQPELSGCKMLPPKVHSSGDLRPSAPKGEHQRKMNSVAIQRKKRRYVKRSHGAKNPTHFEQRKLVLQPQPPKQRGLSTALAVMRSICSGPGEVGVIDAQVRPLLVIAGKCVFRTTAPQDTPRLCTDPNERPRYVPQASNQVLGTSVKAAKNENETPECNGDEDGLPPARSAGVSSAQDSRKGSPHAQPTSKPMLPLLARIHGTSSTLPAHVNKCQATLSSIKYWPPAVAELDNWISQIVNEWLDEDAHVVAVGNSLLSHPSANFFNPVPSSTRGGGCSKEKLEASCASPISKVTEVCNESPKSSLNMLEELGKPLAVPSIELTELDARIHEAQTVYDLSQMLEPISEALMSSVPRSKVAGDMKTSPMSIIQEFGRDDVVQGFQRQILILEQENENLKNSLCEEEHSDLFRRLKALNF